MYHLKGNWTPYDTPSRESDAGPLPPRRDPDEDRDDERDALRALARYYRADGDRAMHVWAAFMYALALFAAAYFLLIGETYIAGGGVCFVLAALVAMAKLPKGGARG